MRARAPRWTRWSTRTEMWRWRTSLARSGGSIRVAASRSVASPAVRERAALLRAQLALTTLGLTAVLVVAILAIDASHHHPLDPHPHLALAAIDALVIWRARASLRWQLRGPRPSPSRPSPV